MSNGKKDKGGLITALKVLVCYFSTRRKKGENLVEDRARFNCSLHAPASLSRTNRPLVYCGKSTGSSRSTGASSWHSVQAFRGNCSSSWNGV